MNSLHLTKSSVKEEQFSEGFKFSVDENEIFKKYKKKTCVLITATPMFYI